MQRALAALTLALVLPLPALVNGPALANVTVKPGDTLGEIAERHGVSVNRLMQANGIKDPTQLQIGQRLVIPGRRAAAASGGGSSGARSAGGSVVVQPGDTLSEIAMRHGVSLQRLMQLNGISNPAMVEAGRRLVLSGGGPASSGSSRGGANAQYTVRSGETLGEIAERHTTSVNRLMQLNGISDPTQLQAGSRIAVPGSGSRRPEATASSGRPVRTTAAREHVVRPGESLSEIADAYSLPLQKLVALNNINDPNLLMSGTRLKLTAPPPVPAARPAPKRPAATAAKPQPKPAAKPAPAVAAKPKPTGTSSASTASASTSSAPTAPRTTATQATSPRTTASQSAPAQTATPKPATPQTTAAQTTTPQTTTPQTATPQTATPQTAAASSASGNKASISTTAPANSSAAATASTASAPATAASITPATTAAATSAAPARRPRATTSTPSTTAAAKPAGPDWRSYGPLQVDWANWQPMGGSFVAPSLNAEGQPLYTAINCGARKLNATSQTGQWRTWEAPSTDAEQQLVSDLCKAKGS